jgi:hypothetical protein
MREKLTNFWLCHLCRVSFFVEEDVAFDPMDIGLLGLDTVMLKPSNAPNLIE